MLPQIIYLVIVAICVILSMFMHGRVYTQDFRGTFISVLISQGLLIWGGFYNCFFN